VTRGNVAMRRLFAVALVWLALANPAARGRAG
jgi:hypothetical protein